MNRIYLYLITSTICLMIWAPLKSNAINVPITDGQVVGKITNVALATANPNVKIIKDSKLGFIVLYPVMDQPFTVNVIINYSAPSANTGQYLNKISAEIKEKVGAGVIINGGAQYKVESTGTKIDQLTVNSGANGGRFTITYDGKSNDTHKDCNVRLLPVEITVAFGEGPDIPDGQGDKNSRELLEEYLDGIKVARQGDVWAVNGKDTQGNEKIWGVEIVSDQVKLNAALSSGGRYVVFDGHSNFGFGPDFLGADQINRISDFTNFGARYTDVPLTFRKLIRNPQNPNDSVNFGDTYGNLVVPDAEIEAAPQNYKPLPINDERFPNIDGVGVGQAFQKQGQGFDTWHYRIQGGSKRLMIDAPKTDLPANLAYKTFFYNACSTGIDYIENFKQGDFIYTNDSCFVLQGTRIYVQGVVEGKTTGQIMPLLNQLGVGNNNPNDTIYEFKSF